MLLTAHKKSGRRGQYLRANKHRAIKRSLLQFRYIYSIKPSWRARFKKAPLPFPKPGQALPDRRKLTTDTRPQIPPILPPSVFHFPEDKKKPRNLLNYGAFLYGGKIGI